jgi:hypothetical protein
MTDDATTTPVAAPAAQRPEADRSKSSYRSAAAATSTVDSRQNGGAGVQRSHLRNRKAWLKTRTRAGQTWAQRKAASVTYCPAKVRAG